MSLAWNVALCSPPYRTFSYSTPDYLPPQTWAPGQRVMVPVGTGMRMGVIMEPLGEAKVMDRALKPMAWPLDQELLLSDDVLDLVRDLAKRQMVPEGFVLSHVLPKSLRSGMVRFAFTEKGVERRLGLGEMLRLASEELTALGEAWIQGRLKPLGWEHGSGGELGYMLLRDPPWGLRPGAKRQSAVLDYLFAHGCSSPRRIAQGLAQGNGPTDPEASAVDLRRGLGRVLGDLVRKGLVQAVPVLSSGECPAPAGLDSARQNGRSLEFLALTDEQTDALAALETDLDLALQRGRGRIRLLHGVTGSGKTLVYLHLVRKALAYGKSVLLLAPEVALTAQLWSEVNRCFPDTPRHLYHGYLAAGAKLAVFRALRHQATPQIVVGTRSSLFLPFANLGLVVLDEEHDASYKQDEGFTYHAKELAYFRINSHGGLLLLGSATPDVKSFHAANQDEIGKVSLRQRVSRRPLPEIQLVDMRAEARSEPLSRVCRFELERVLEQREQAMFLLNRRGFAPLVSCLDCGTAPKCPRCEVGLTYHKTWERLLCHYCGHVQPFPCGCGQCGGTRFLPMGEGTERLEEYLQSLVAAEQGILRLDRDSTRRKGKMENILDAFAQGQAQVMVGTQMLSKGHHFPNVTLVVAVDGDVGLNLPDYRAAEKTFQLLVQLAGRAGRGERPGRVLIQTSNPEHPCWEHIRTGNYEGFFSQELERRRKFGYPPFVKLAMIRLSYPREWEPGAALVARAGELLRREGARLGLRVLGPVPAPLSQLNGRKRFQCLVKAFSWRDLRGVFAAMQTGLPGSSPLRASLDLDPVNML